MYAYRSLILILWLSFNHNVLADFSSKYNCRDTELVCVQDGGEREIEGYRVHRPCWAYKYTKVCDVPSKNDCSKYSKAGNCIKRQADDYDKSDPDQEAPEIKCLAFDNDGSCLNEQREYSCEEPEMEEVVNTEVVFDPDAKDAPKAFSRKMKCISLGCSNGECVNAPRVKAGDEMGEAVGYLALANKMAEDVRGAIGNIRVNIFGGNPEKCSRKVTGYVNCCNGSSGWGKSLGAKCRDSQKLLKARSEGKCHYIGEYCADKKLGVCIVHKKSYCCYDSVLSRVIQEQGRVQLGISYGTAEQPQCRGFTIEEIVRLDFSKIDLREFYNEIFNKASNNMAGDKQTEFKQRIERSIPNIKIGSGNAADKHTKGLNAAAIKANNKQNIEHENSKVNPNYLREKTK